MQLETHSRTAPVRPRLHAAACLLLAAGLPAAARADSGASWRFEGSALLYGEKARARVVEPTARITRLFANGQSLSAQLGFDSITGASPSGALPSGRIQTTTTPSGQVQTLPAGRIPVTTFKDTRGSLDLEWLKPLGGRITATTGAHLSREKDYRSLGANEVLSVELMHKLTTLSVGGGLNRDRVMPTGGTALGLTDGETLLRTSADAKRVSTATAGVSRILTRRWMVSANVSRTFERGYLTEPYKVVSLVDGQTGMPTSALTEKRPSARNRTSILASSVYHLTDDVLYSSYRSYRDDWGIRSSTFDLKYRDELEDGTYLQPHVRYYTQSGADFFVHGLVQGAALPEFASSDYRLGRLKTATVGVTYGFRPQGRPGEFAIRAEYMRQWGQGHPADAVGVQRDFDLFPRLNIGSLMATYTVEF